MPKDPLGILPDPPDLAAPPSADRPDPLGITRTTPQAPSAVADPFDVSRYRPGARLAAVTPRPPDEPTWTETAVEAGKGALRGVAVELPRMAGESLQFFDPRGGTEGVRRTGAAIERGAEHIEGLGLEEDPRLGAMRREDPLSLKAGVVEGATMLGPSMALPLAGAGAGMLFGGPVGATIGAAAGFAASLPLYFGSQAKDTYDRGYQTFREQGMGDEEAHDRAVSLGIKTGAIEAGGEAIADLITMKLLRLLPDTIKQEVVRSATKGLRGTGEIVKSAARQMGVEVGTEVGQVAGQLAVEEAEGVGPGLSWDNVKGVIIPTMTLSLLTLGAAEGVGAHNRRSVRRALSDPERPTDERMRAVKAVEGEVLRNTQDPELAALWSRYSMDQVRKNEPVAITDDEWYREYQQTGNVDLTLSRDKLEDPTTTAMYEPTPWQPGEMPEAAPWRERREGRAGEAGRRRGEDVDRMASMVIGSRNPETGEWAATYPVRARVTDVRTQPAADGVNQERVGYTLAGQDGTTFEVDLQRNTVMATQPGEGARTFAYELHTAPQPQIATTRESMRGPTTLRDVRGPEGLAVPERERARQGVVETGAVTEVAGRPAVLDAGAPTVTFAEETTVAERPTALDEGAPTVTAPAPAPDQRPAPAAPGVETARYEAEVPAEPGPGRPVALDQGVVKAGRLEPPTPAERGGVVGPAQPQTGETYRPSAPLVPPGAVPTRPPELDQGPPALARGQAVLDAELEARPKPPAPGAPPPSPAPLPAFPAGPTGPAGQAGQLDPASLLQAALTAPDEALPDLVSQVAEAIVSTAAAEAAATTDYGQRAMPIDPNAVPSVVNNQVPSPDVPPGQRLLCIACGEKKGDQKTEAINLYQGPMFQTLRAHRGELPDTGIAILSAEHGWMNPTRQTAPYNRRMTKPRSDELIAGGIHEEGVPGNMRRGYFGGVFSRPEVEDRPDGSWRYVPREERPFRDVLIVGSEHYRRASEAAIAQLQELGIVAPDAAINVTSGGIGEQRKQLGQWLRQDWTQPEEKTGAVQPEAVPPVRGAREGQEPPTAAEGLAGALPGGEVVERGEEAETVAQLERHRPQVAATFEPPAAPEAELPLARQEGEGLRDWQARLARTVLPELDAGEVLTREGPEAFENELNAQLSRRFRGGDRRGIGWELADEDARDVVAGAVAEVARRAGARERFTFENYPDIDRRVVTALAAGATTAEDAREFLVGASEGMLDVADLAAVQAEMDRALARAPGEAAAPEIPAFDVVTARPIDAQLLEAGRDPREFADEGQKERYLTAQRRQQGLPALPAPEAERLDLTGRENLPTAQFMGEPGSQVPITMTGFRGRAVKEGAPSSEARFGRGRYWSSMRDIAEEFADSRGEGAYVEEGTVTLDRPFFAEAPDTSTPEFARFREGLPDEARRILDLSTRPQGSEQYPHALDAVARVLADQQPIEQRRASMFPAGELVREHVERAGYDGIVSPFGFGSVPTSIEVVEFTGAELAAPTTPEPAPEAEPTLADFGLTVEETMTTPSRRGKKARPVWVVRGDFTGREDIFREAGGRKYRGAWSFFSDPTDDLTEALAAEGRRSFAERREARQARAEARAERAEESAEKARGRAGEAFEAGRRATEGIPMGQPILVGHHSEAKHRRDIERSHRAMARGIAEQDKAAAHAGRAAGARETARPDEELPLPGLQNRLDTAETELRDVERRLAGESRAYGYGEPATGEYREQLETRQADLREQVAYWRGLIEQRGGVTYSRENVRAGDMVKIRHGWGRVKRANPKTVTVVITEGGAAGMELKYKYAEITEHRSQDSQEARGEATDEAAHEAATSPANARREPTQDQKEAENYKAGDVIDLAGGVKVRVENPIGSTRFSLDEEAIAEVTEELRELGTLSGVVAQLDRVQSDMSRYRESQDPALLTAALNRVRNIGLQAHWQARTTVRDRPALSYLHLHPSRTGLRGWPSQTGPMPATTQAAKRMRNVAASAWSNVIQDHYGRLLRTEAADGDAVDVFLGPEAEAEAPRVFVVNQVRPDTGAFDEHKVMFGYESEGAARQAYARNYPADWQGFGSLIEMPLADFTTWLRDTRKTGAVDEVTLLFAESAREADERAARAAGLAPKVADQLQLATPDGQRVTIIGEDVEEPGKFRATWFDARGPGGHTVFDTPDAAIDEALRDGYTEETEDALDKLEGTEEWNRGIAQIEEVRRRNAEGWVRSLEAEVERRRQAFEDVRGESKRLRQGFLADVRLAFDAIGTERLEAAAVIKPGQTYEELAEQFRTRESEWKGPRKLRDTGLQLLARRGLFGNTKEAERLRKALRAYVQASRRGFFESQNAQTEHLHQRIAPAREALTKAEAELETARKQAGLPPVEAAPAPAEAAPPKPKSRGLKPKPIELPEVRVEAVVHPLDFRATHVLVDPDELPGEAPPLEAGTPIRVMEPQPRSIADGPSFQYLEGDEVRDVMSPPENLDKLATMPDAEMRRRLELVGQQRMPGMEAPPEPEPAIPVGEYGRQIFAGEPREVVKKLDAFLEQHADPAAQMEREAGENGVGESPVHGKRIYRLDDGNLYRVTDMEPDPRSDGDEFQALRLIQPGEVDFYEEFAHLAEPAPAESAQLREEPSAEPVEPEPEPAAPTGDRFAKSDRVVITGGSEEGLGRHGVVIEKYVTTWQRTGEGTEDRTVSYVVRTDGGAEFQRSEETLEPETGEAPTAVRDIQDQTGRWLPPQHVPAMIEQANARGQGFRRKAHRARKPENMRKHLNTADEFRAAAADLTARWEAWAADYPELAAEIMGDKYAAVPRDDSGVPVPPADVPELTMLRESGARLERSGERAEKLTVYFNGKPSEAVRDLLKSHGFRWSRALRGWWPRGPAGRAAFEAWEQGQESSTQPTDVPTAQPPEAAAAVEAPPVAPAPAAPRKKIGLKAAAVPGKLRALADKLDAQIENAERPDTRNMTPKRARELASRMEGGRRLRKLQDVLRAMADAHEAGTLDPVLAGIITRAGLERAMRGATWEGGVRWDHSIRRGLLDAIERLHGIKDERERLVRAVPDAMTTVLDDFEALDKAVARATKSNRKRKLPWQVVDYVEERRAFRRMGLDTSERIAQAKAALAQLAEGAGTVPAETEREQRVRKLEMDLVGTKPGVDYFPTPPDIVRRMLNQMGLIEPGMRVLEPSAGKGNILDLVREEYPGAELAAVELSPTLVQILEAKDYPTTMGDFLEHQPEQAPDRVLMNPPFGKGADMKHVRHAYDVLAPGGRLVAIMSEGPWFRGDVQATEFRDWLETVGADSYKLEAGDLADKAVTQRSNVSGRMVWVDKPAEAAPAAAEVAEAPPTAPADEQRAQVERSGTIAGKTHDGRSWTVKVAHSYPPVSEQRQRDFPDQRFEYSLEVTLAGTKYTQHGSDHRPRAYTLKDAQDAAVEAAQTLSWAPGEDREARFAHGRDIAPVVFGPTAARQVDKNLWGLSEASGRAMDQLEIARLYMGTSLQLGSTLEGRGSGNELHHMTDALRDYERGVAEQMPRELLEDDAWVRGKYTESGMYSASTPDRALANLKKDKLDPWGAFDAANLREKRLAFLRGLGLQDVADALRQAFQEHGDALVGRRRELEASIERKKKEDAEKQADADAAFDLDFQAPPASGRFKKPTATSVGLTKTSFNWFPVELDGAWAFTNGHVLDVTEPHYKGWSDKAGDASDPRVRARQEELKAWKLGKTVKEYGGKPYDASSVVKDHHRSPSSRNRLTLVASHEPAAKDKPPVAILEREEDGAFTVVNHDYFRYFTSKYPGAVFYGEDELADGAIAVHHDGRLVGLVMPIRPDVAHTPQRARAALTQRAQDETTPHGFAVGDAVVDFQGRTGKVNRIDGPSRFATIQVEWDHGMPTEVQASTIRKPVRRARDLSAQPELPLGGDAERVRAQIAPVLASWPASRRPVVRVVDSASQIPTEYEALAIDRGMYVPPAPGRPATLYLIARNLPTELEALQALAHEAVGHYAIEELLGEEFNAIRTDIMRLVRRSDNQVAVAYAEARARGYRGEELVPETIAIMAENGVQHPIMVRVIRAVRAFLRKLGFRLELSPSEVEALIEDAARYLEGANVHRASRSNVIADRRSQRRRDPFRHPDYSLSEIEAAMRTGREPSADAVVPRLVRERASTDDRMLDFGAGRNPVHADAMLAEGWDVTPHDLWNEPDGDPELDVSYDVVMANDVVNVQPSEVALQKVLDQLWAVTAPSGRVVVNLPEAARRAGAWTGTRADAERLGGELLERFYEVERIGGARDTPVIEARRPRESYREVARARLRSQTRYARGWHGTRRPFAGDFSLAHMGTGEGTQAYGWGLYAAEKRRIAETYQRLDPFPRYRGEQVHSSGLSDFERRLGFIGRYTGTPEQRTDAVRGQAYQAISQASGETEAERIAAAQQHTQAARDEYRAFAAQADREAGKLEREDPADAIAEMYRVDQRAYTASAEFLTDVVELLEQTRPGDFRRGALYEVELPEKAELLDYDEFLSAQPEAVYTAVRKAVIDVLGDTGLNLNHMTGLAVYNLVSNQLGGDRAASEHLDKHGVPGMKFLDAHARSGARAKTHNFVIWRESAMKKVRRDRRRPRRAAAPAGPPSRKGLVTRVRETVDGLGPLGKLPQKAEYLKLRYRTLGKLGDVQRDARALYDAFANAGEETAQQVFEYLTDPTASSRRIADPVYRQRAETTKKTIENVGRQLVLRGLLPLETFKANQGGYLPRLYLKHMLGEQVFTALARTGTGKKPSKLGYLIARKQIPEDVRRLILGEITAPGYLAAKGYGVQMRDVALLDWLAAMSGNQQWVLPDSFVEYRGRRVTPFYLKDEARRIRKQAHFYTDADAVDARRIADEMDAVADTALQQLDVDEHSHWRQVPDTRRYGALRGAWIRQEIHDDVVGSFSLIPADASIAEWLLGNGGVATRLTQLWKWSKVAANPPAQFRNFMSNGILLHMSGVPMYLVPVRVAQAIREMRTGGPHYKVAQDYGVTESTFAAQELIQLDEEFIDYKARHEDGLGMARLVNMAHRIMRVTSSFYQASETVFKTAKIIDAMRRQGMAAPDAALEAHKWMIDYSLVHPSVRYLRNAPIGVPFVTFYVKTLPRMIEAIAKRPWVMLPYLALPYVLTKVIARMEDVEEEDVAALRLALPQWLQERGHAYFIPGKDEHGRWRAIDFGYIYPWAMWTELFREVGQGELGDAIQTSGFVGGPLPDMITAVKTNTDPFTRQPIVHEFDPPARQAASLMNYLWRLSMPTFITDIGWRGHLESALSDEVDRWGRPKSTVPQAWARLVGLNVYPVEPERTRALNLRRQRFEIQQMQRRARQLLRDPNLTDEERKTITAQFTKMIDQATQEIREYRKASRVHPRLRTGT